VNADSDPRLLLIETSGRAGAVAVALGGQLLGVRRLEEARRHTRDLAPAAAELLAAQGWRPRDVQAVVVSRGPGSYTGLRVGIMSAKAFAYATSCAAIAVDTFAVVAAQAPEAVTRLDVLADAQQDKVYVQPFARGQGWQPLAPLAICKFTDWLARRQPQSWVSGPGLYRWAVSLPPNTLTIEPSRRDPTPEALLQLGLALYRSGHRDDLWTLEPLYLRPSSAEEQWQARSTTPKTAGGPHHET
jgi:tRNA threonylcarbamoyladenosine biosynthesis protein TsaB